MNEVAAITWALANIERSGDDLRLKQLEQRLENSEVAAADQQECREWMDCMLAELGADARAVDGVIHKLSTVGATISQRLNRTALEKRSVEELRRLMEALWQFKDVIEKIVPKR